MRYSTLIAHKTVCIELEIQVQVLWNNYLHSGIGPPEEYDQLKIFCQDVTSLRTVSFSAHILVLHVPTTSVVCTTLCDALPAGQLYSNKEHAVPGFKVLWSLLSLLRSSEESPIHHHRWQEECSNGWNAATHNKKRIHYSIGITFLD